MAVTRIKNNQITDSTITYTKIAPGTLVGSVFNPNITLNSNVTILGNLTVANSFAQLNSINTYINDPLVVFNNNYAGSPTYDIGLLVNRNLSSLAPYGAVNAAWVWKEADTAFEGILTTETGTTAGSINNSGYANLKIGNVTSISETISGVLTAGSIQNTPIGSVTTSSGAFTTLAASGLVTFTSSAASNSYTSGALVVTGGVGVGGNVNVFGNITTATGNIITTSAGFFIGNTTTGFGAMYAGIPTGYTVLPQLVAQFSENYNGYSQINTQNINSGNQATTDYVATANNGTDTTFYVDLGIASSGYDGTNPNNSLGNVLYPNDSYLYAQGNTGASIGGNLVVGTTVHGRNLVIITGGVNTDHTAATFWHAGTASTTSTNGTFVLNGGMGVSGNVNVGGGMTIAGNLAVNGTLTYLNTTVTQVTGTEVVAGVLTANSSTASTSSSTGALVVAGGAGVAGDVFVGQTLNVAQKSVLGGNVIITSGSDVTAASGVGALMITGSGGASIASNVSIGNNLYVGGSSAFGQALSSAGIVVSKGAASYAQIALKNTSSSGSADYAAYADNGSDAGGWVDMGVAGSAFSDPTYTITKAQDGYLITRPSSATYGGNLVIGTSEAGSYNDITLSVGSFYANAEVARFHGNTSTSGTFTLKLPTVNTLSANTGAMQVWGGASFGGNTYTGGSSTQVGGGVFNTARASAGTLGSANQNAFIVQGVSDSTLIYAKPLTAYDAVVIGGNSASSSFPVGAKFIVNSTDSILLPVGTNAQRPGSAGGTDTTGMFRYNTSLNALEYYGGSTPGWQSVTSQFTVIADQQANGDGVTTVFTLSEAQTTNSCIVSINGVIQIPTLAYSVSGTTLTFTEAPATGDVIDIRKLTTTVTVTNLTSTNGYMQLQVDNNGAYVYSGASSTAITTKWDTAGAEVNTIANVVTTTTGASSIDAFSTTAYSSAEYTVTATITGTDIREMAKVMVVHDGVTATRVVFGVVSTSGNSLVSYSANVVSGNATLYATPANANTTIRIDKNYQAI
jgi:hypothetical protein